MVQLKEVKCSNCNGPSYFPNDKNSGYCINCGRIVNCEEGNTRAINIYQPVEQPKKEYSIHIIYNRTDRAFDQALRAELLGDAEMTFYVSKDGGEIITLPEGNYQLAFFSHISQGVHSTDVVNNIRFTLKSDRIFTVSTRRPFFGFGFELAIE